MKEIPLTQGKFALVDDEDFEFLTQWKWRFDNGYAVATTPGPHNLRKHFFMHRIILNVLPFVEVDHKNRNRSDNRRSNLRIATSAQNQWNMGIPLRNTSGFKGVSWKSNGWESSIKVNNKNIYLGRFPTKEKAAQVYNEAAKKYFNDFARINKI